MLAIMRLTPTGASSPNAFSTRYCMKPVADYLKGRAVYFHSNPDTLLSTISIDYFNRLSARLISASRVHSWYGSVACGTWRRQFNMLILIAPQPCHRQTDNVARLYNLICPTKMHICLACHVGSIEILTHLSSAYQEAQCNNTRIALSGNDQNQWWTNTISTPPTPHSARTLTYATAI
jgi:hypothetical protein